MSLHTQILFASVIVFSLGIPWVYQRRSGKKLGCVTFGYIALVVSMITLFTIALTTMLGAKSVRDIETIANGKYYKGQISGFGTNEEKMYTPYFSFTAEEGNTVTVEASYSSGGEPAVGESVNIFYDQVSGNSVELGAGFFILTIGAIIMWIVLALVFGGIVWYALALDMNKYFFFLKKTLTIFFMPLIMISFEALLIYAFFYGNEVPWFVKGILAFFILILGLATVGMIKMQIENWLKPQKSKDGKRRKKVGHKIRNKP